MKLWDSLTTCLILLSTVHASLLLRNRQSTPRRARATERLRDFLPVQISVSLGSAANTRSELDTDDGEEVLVEEQKSDSLMEELHPDQFEDVVDFIKVTISRIHRSSSTPSSSSSTSSSDLNLRTRHRRERKKGAGRSSSRGAVKGTGRRGKGGSSGGRRGGGQGCVLKQIHLNVSDLGLGYQTREEMIFKYCSGPCRKSETNYDKILNNLTHNRKLLPEVTPFQACCRPIEFDDALSFLDDNLIYHTMRKHSAKKCGCV